MDEGPIITDTDIAKSTQEQLASTFAIAMAMVMTVEALHLLAVEFDSLAPIPVSNGDEVALDMVVVVMEKAAMMVLAAPSHEVVDAATHIGTKTWLTWRSWLGDRRSGVVGRRFRLRGGGMMSRHQG
jgi:hypothetical protein